MGDTIFKRFNQGGSPTGDIPASQVKFTDNEDAQTKVTALEQNVGNLQTTVASHTTAIAALQSEIDSFIGAQTNFVGIVASTSALPTVTEPSWGLVGSDIDALNAYVFNGTSWTQFGTKTYDFTDFSDVKTQLTELEQAVNEITEGSSAPQTIELHPTKINGKYYWDGAEATNPSYFYVHIDVNKDDVVKCMLSISGSVTQSVRFVDAYNGNTRVASACSSSSIQEYVVPDGVDNLYLSIAFNQSYYDYYYFEIYRIVTNVAPKGFGELNRRVSELETAVSYNRTKNSISASAAELSVGQLLNVATNIDNKKNQSYRFTAKFASFDYVNIGHGWNVYGGSYIKVDSTNITAYYNNGSVVQMGQWAHGLIISDFIDVIIKVGDVNNTRSEVTIMTKGGDFKQGNVPMGGSTGSIFAFGHQEMSDIICTYTISDITENVWIFGDSYISVGDPNRWASQLMSYGYTRYLLSGFSGATSTNEVTSLREILRINKPRILVWCLGMNDGDNGSINTSWMSCLNEVIGLCEDNGIELVLCTIPNTPRITNTYKNAYIRESGYRYVDFAKAVNAESAGATWYEGMLSSDNVHPLVLGAKALANRFLIDVPEIDK